MAESEPPEACAVGVFDQDELIAVGLIGPEGEPGAWRVRGMATAPQARGRGAGTAVLDALLRHARAHAATSVWASVRTPARRLYERAGFRADSEEYELPDIGPHVLMRLSLQSQMKLARRIVHPGRASSASTSHKHPARQRGRPAARGTNDDFDRGHERAGPALCALRRGVERH